MRQAEAQLASGGGNGAHLEEQRLAGGVYEHSAAQSVSRVVHVAFAVARRRQVQAESPHDMIDAVRDPRRVAALMKNRLNVNLEFLMNVS